MRLLAAQWNRKEFARIHTSVVRIRNVARAAIAQNEISTCSFSLLFFYDYNLTVDRTAAEWICMTVARQPYEFARPQTINPIHVLPFSSDLYCTFWKSGVHKQRTVVVMQPQRIWRIRTTVVRLYCNSYGCRMNSCGSRTNLFLHTAAVSYDPCTSRSTVAAVRT